MSERYNLLVSVNSILQYKINGFTRSKIVDWYSERDKDSHIEIALWVSSQTRNHIDGIIDIITSIEYQVNYSEYRFDLGLVDITTLDSVIALVFELKLNRIDEE
jgi:hypothetical protein